MAHEQDEPIETMFDDWFGESKDYLRELFCEENEEQFSLWCRMRFEEYKKRGE